MWDLVLQDSFPDAGDRMLSKNKMRGRSLHLRLNPTLAEYLAHVNSLKMQDLLFSIGFNFTCRIYFYTQPTCIHFANYDSNERF